MKQKLCIWLCWLGFPLVAATLMSACSRSTDRPNMPSLELKSSSFVDDTIPQKYSSCGGRNDVSPELSWNSPPDRTQSFVLIAFDKDSLLGFQFTHWVLFDLPPDKRKLDENVVKQAQLPDGSRQGPNDYDRIGYVGPCPPGHSPHHYVFDLYAVDTKLNLPPGATRKQVVKAMKGHVLARGQVIARFQH